jgi:hypothetical protein
MWARDKHRSTAAEACNVFLLLRVSGCVRFRCHENTPVVEKDGNWMALLLHALGEVERHGCAVRVIGDEVHK